ncbi:unnamed protein product [Effrenium voratum]|nr:unnamed protein product [Effrenium voratum]
MQQTISTWINASCQVLGHVEHRLFSADQIDQDVRVLWPAMLPREAAHGGALPPSGGRRYIGCEEHMLDAGTSVPFAGRHGYGRRHNQRAQETLDLSDQPDAELDDRLWGSHGPVPRGPSPRVAADAWKGPSEAESYEAPRAPSTAEMKGAVEEWLREVYGIHVVDPKRWDQVMIGMNGSYWVVRALDLQAVSLTREGATAKHVAEKLSLMRMTELRHFGLQNVSPVAEVCEKPTLTPNLRSPGVHHILGTREANAESPGLSSSRPNPEELGKRKVQAGKESMNILCQSQVDAIHGGRKYIEARDNLTSGAAIEEVGKDRGFVPMRKPAPVVSKGGPLW